MQALKCNTHCLKLYVSQGNESLWKYLHEKLNLQDPERFSLPDCPDAHTFEASFSSLSESVNIIIDEANNLDSVPASTLDTFLNILRGLRHLQNSRYTQNSKSSGLGALIMVGTEELLSTLKKEDKTSPFNHVSSALVLHLACILHHMFYCIAVLHIVVLCTSPPVYLYLNLC